jgi:hypothetical protein
MAVDDRSQWRNVGPNVPTEKSPEQHFTSFELKGFVRKKFVDLYLIRPLRQISALKRHQQQRNIHIKTPEEAQQ